MKFLIIVQDLRISGTSEGIVSRSFIGKLRECFQEAIIDVHYLKNNSVDQQTAILPVNSINEYLINREIPFILKWINKIYWRLFHVSLKEKHIQKKYKNIIKNIVFESYDVVFIRSSGLEYESILACKDLPIIKSAIINFHDPYPIFYDTSSNIKLTKLELFNYYTMLQTVQQARACITPSQLLSKDLRFLYGSAKKFHTLPHQYCSNVFNLSDVSKVRIKQKNISISYHGGMQFGRNLDILLDAFAELIEEDNYIKENVELVFRIKSAESNRLIEKYKTIDNIFILDSLSFSNSANEQMYETDIVILLESYLNYSNILLGKAPFVASLKKPVLALLPVICELRNIIKNDKYIARSNDGNDIKNKLRELIHNFEKEKIIDVFGDYFSNEKFKEMLDELIFYNRQTDSNI